MSHTFESACKIRRPWLLAAVAILLLHGIRARRRAMLRFAGQGLWAHLIPATIWPRRWARLILLLLAMLMLVGGMIDPRAGTRFEQVQRRGIDILFVVASAARSGLTDPPSMIELTRLPLSLLPTFIVPLIIASHIVVFVRLGWQGRRAAAPAQL